MIEIISGNKNCWDARKDYPTRDGKTVLKELIHKLQNDSKVIYHIFQSMSKKRLKRFVFYVLEKDVGLVYGIAKYIERESNNTGKNDEVL